MIMTTGDDEDFDSSFEESYDDSKYDVDEDSDSYTEYSEQGWGSRIKDALGGVLIGLLLFIISFPLLWWNEGRSVRTAKGLEEAGGAVVSLSAEQADPTKNGKLVHVSGDLTATSKVKDKKLKFKPKTRVLKLQRRVMMYQWVEKREKKSEKKLGGKTVTKTVYRYTKEWRDSPVDSSTFRRAETHRNPSFPIKSKTFYTKEAKLGAYTLPKDMLASLGGWEELPVNYKKLKLKRKIRKRLYLIDDQEEGEEPRIGSIKLVYWAVPSPTPVSVVAKLSGTTFEPYVTQTNTQIYLIRNGIKSANSMIAAQQSANKIMTWVLRLIGFILMFLGITMILRPLVVVADVIPFLGSLVGAGSSIAAFALALPLTLITIALAWMFYRPLLSIILLVIGGGAFAGIYFLKGKKKATKVDEETPEAA